MKPIVAKDLEPLLKPIKELKLLHGNPRKGDVEAVKTSYQTFGQRKPIVATKDGTVIAGNHQLLAAIDLEWDSIAVVVTDDDDLKAKAYALADNKTAELGSYDNELLSALLQEVSVDEELIKATAFNEDELLELMGSHIQTDQELDELGPLPEKAKTKKGDKYQLGDHILVCGDSTDLQYYPEEAEICLTDPPYGVDYVGKTDDKLKIKNDDLNTSLEVMDQAFENISKVVNKNVFIFHPNKYHSEVLDRFKKYFYVSNVLVWVKNSFVMSRSDFHWRYEPIIYGWVEKNGHNWYGDRKQDNVLLFDRPTARKEHPTMKPVDLLEYLILLTTRVGDVVIDPFSGSGSTLIACELNKRSCYAIELDPIYCDVIIKRWEDLTGGEAQLIVE